MPKILDFAKNSQPFQIKNKTATTAEIMLYGAIGASFWEDSITAKQFSDELKTLPDTVNEIVVRINSPGGDCFDGIAIMNRLKQHPAKVKVKIDGLCASIATIIACAADEIEIGEGALFMIHLPWTLTAGNRMDLENVGNRLMDIEEQMVSIYKKKTKLDRSEIRSMLEQETWMDADQAMEHGFVDSKAGETFAIAASLLDKATWINKKPKMRTTDNVVKDEIKNLKNKVEQFLARK